MGGFECERVDMKQLVLCVACSTGSYQEAQRVNLNQKLRPVLRAEFLYTANLRARLRKVSIFAIVIDKRIICCYTYNQGQRLK